MTIYPNSQDSNITLPGVSGISEEDIAINALRDAAFAIEKELGIVPSGVYSDVRSRLDILEARINSPTSTISLNDGYANSPFFLVNTPQSVTLSISDGYGFPTENRLNGSIYLRSDGYANNDFYIRRSGMWKAIQSDPFTASGDLSGTYLTQTVIGIRGKSLNSSLASVGSTQDGYHLTWDNADGYWRAETGFIAGGDLSAISARFGRTSQKVIKIQNNPISPVAPIDGYTLVWSSTDNQWQPRINALIFTNSVSAGDGYITRTNISSNKLLQSPSISAASKIGMVNLGSRSIGTSTGVTENYAAILSGDKHSVSGNFGVVVAGESNTVSGQYAAVIDGYANTASAQYSMVLNGTNNLASQTQAFVLDGYNNIASGLNSYVLGGYSNGAAASLSSVLGGFSNNVVAGATDSSIGRGSNNTIAATSISSNIINGFLNTTNGQNNTIVNGIALNIGLSNFATIINGNVNTISATSNFGTIINGSSSLIDTLSTYATIVNGYNIYVKGLNSTVVNANTASVDGLHSTILNGNNLSIVGNYSSILNGLNNNIISSPNYSFILDGYSQSVSGSSSWVGDGYNNSIAGLYSSILNGNTNVINGNSNTILNGSNNTINSTSINNTILSGISNTVNSSTQTLLQGNSNTLIGTTSSFVFGNSNSVTGIHAVVNGSSNNITGINAVVNGSSNTVSSTDSIANGNFNNVNGSLGYNYVFGQSNVTNSVSGYNLVSGLSNQVDGYYSLVSGQNNLATSDGYNSLVHGKFAKARIFGQYSQAVSNFNGNTTGEAQYSRVVLTGSGAAGSAFYATIPGDGYVSFEDGKSYDFNIRVLVVNNQPSIVDANKPTRFVYDVLASQENGTLTLHDVVNTSINQNGTGWTVTVSSVGNKLIIQVDAAVFPASPIPFNTSNRRVIATIEWRTITRI